MAPRILRKTDYVHPTAAPIAVRLIEQQEDDPGHRHEFNELVVVHAGKGTHFVEDETYPVETGDVFVIDVRSLHGYRDVSGLALTNVIYDPDRPVLDASLAARIAGYHALFTFEPRYRSRHAFAGKLHLAGHQLLAVRKLLSAMTQEEREKRPGYELMLTGLFVQLVCTLSRHYSRMSSPATGALLRLGQALSYVEEHYDEAITLPHLARLSKMSVSSFQRAFRTTTGSSPIDYVLRLRIDRARQILRTGELSVSEVAYAVGFHDSNYFARQFKKQVGQSPRQFAKA
jgi:AraC-like DNA-binding protein